MYQTMCRREQRTLRNKTITDTKIYFYKVIVIRVLTYVSVMNGNWERKAAYTNRRN